MKKKEDIVSINIEHISKKDHYMENCVRRTDRKSIVTRTYLLIQVGVIIIVMIILGILFFMRKKGNIYNHLLERIGIN